MKKDITELYVFVDNFCKLTEKYINWHILGNKPKITREVRLSNGELVTIMLLYHQSPIKNFKAFCYYTLPYYKADFPKLLSYNRLVELMPRVLHLFSALLKFLLVKQTNESYVDSTPLEVCGSKRTKSHKVFCSIANLGKTTKGWFYGLKLHIIITTKGELVDVKLTSGNVDDRKALLGMTRYLSGLLFADKGYLGKNIFQALWDLGIKLVTGLRKNMKNKFISTYEKIMLRKRSLIESVFNVLKNKFEIEHTRHRAVFNFLVHLISTLVAYSLTKNKPKISQILPLIPQASNF